MQKRREEDSLCCIERGRTARKKIPNGYPPHGVRSISVSVFTSVFISLTSVFHRRTSDYVRDLFAGYGPRHLSRMDLDAGRWLPTYVGAPHNCFDPFFRSTRVLGSESSCSISSVGGGQVYRGGVSVNHLFFTWGGFKYLCYLIGLCEGFLTAVSRISPSNSINICSHPKWKINGSH